MPRVPGLLIVGLIAALVAAAFVLPVPEAAQLRVWASGAGAAAPVLMFLTYVLATLVPIPRTVFSLASGLLLGPVIGLMVALVATVVSGLLSFALARSLGRRVVARHLDRSPVRAVDERLTGGGWLAIASLRMIPVVPFLPTNYACGLSSVRTRPFVAGTVTGSVPGTTAVVVLGDALTGTTPPALLAVLVVLALTGATGLWFALHRH